MARKITFKKIALGERERMLSIGVIIAVAALLISYNLYKVQSKRAEGLRSDIVEERERIVLRKDIAKIDKLRDAYHKYLYKNADTYVLRDTISDLAKKSGIDILSIQPQASEGFGDYVRVSFRLKLRCSYSQLGEFTERIESHPALTKVDDIELNARRDYEGQRRQEAAGPEKETYAEASVLISAYCIKS